jgi:hypothetical protein
MEDVFTLMLGEVTFAQNQYCLFSSKVQMAELLCTIIINIVGIEEMSILKFILRKFLDGDWSNLA